MMIRIFNELKEELKDVIQNNSMTPQRTQIKKNSRKHRNN
jgi:hypothetical protein